MTGSIPPEIALLTGLERLDIRNNPTLTGCIPASLQQVNYDGDLPFCAGATSKKALTPAEPSLLG